MSLRHKISSDLKESQIDWIVIISFVPIAFFTYLFHEFGHWVVGELMGNDMTLSLNNAAPSSGSFIKESHALWSAIGGPLFTVIQAFLFLLVTWLTKSIYAYSVVFFAVFSRFFSIVFGGIDLQDEARIAVMLDTNKYFISAVVLIVLFLILWKSSTIRKVNWKGISYFYILGTLATLLVLAVNNLIS